MKLINNVDFSDSSDFTDFPKVIWNLETPSILLDYKLILWYYKQLTRQLRKVYRWCNYANSLENLTISFKLLLLANILWEDFWTLGVALKGFILSASIRFNLKYILVQ